MLCGKKRIVRHLRWDFTLFRKWHHMKCWIHLTAWDDISGLEIELCKMKHTVINRQPKAWKCRKGFNQENVHLILTAFHSRTTEGLETRLIKKGDGGWNKHFILRLVQHRKSTLMYLFLKEHVGLLCKMPPKPTLCVSCFVGMCVPVGTVFAGIELCQRQMEQDSIYCFRRSPCSHFACFDILHRVYCGVCERLIQGVGHVVLAIHGNTIV